MSGQRPRVEDSQDRGHQAKGGKGRLRYGIILRVCLYSRTRIKETRIKETFV